MSDPERAARNLLRKFPGIRLPIRLHRICDFLGVEIRYTAAPKHIFDAYYTEGLFPPVKRLIIVNDEFPLAHQRFSVAHELGHYVLGHGAAGFLKAPADVVREDWQEIEANRFAAELLMPELLLRKHCVARAEQIRYLCDVSLSAARIRMEELRQRKTSPLVAAVHRRA